MWISATFDVMNWNIIVYGDSLFHAIDHAQIVITKFRIES